VRINWQKIDAVSAISHSNAHLEKRRLNNWKKGALFAQQFVKMRTPAEISSRLTTFLIGSPFVRGAAIKVSCL